MMRRFYRHSPLYARCRLRWHTCHGHDHHQHAHGAHAPSSFELDSSKIKPEYVKACKRITIVGALVNASFAVGKMTIGASGDSVSLYADGFHSLVDVISDCVAYGSLVFAALKLKKCKFPYGAGRVETVGAVAVSLMLCLGAVGLFWHSVLRLYQSLVQGDGKEESKSCTEHHGHSHGEAHGHSHFTLFSADGSQILWSMVGICLSSLLLKEYLYHITKKVGERAGSAVVVANAYHHRADAWSSGVALLGVLGKCCGFPLADTIGGAVVAGIIVKMTSKLLIENSAELLCFQTHETQCALQSIPRLLAKDYIALINAVLLRHGRRATLIGTLVVKKEQADAITHVQAAIAEIKHFLEESVGIDSSLADVRVDVFIATGDASNTKDLLKMLCEFHLVSLNDEETKMSTVHLFDKEKNSDVSPNFREEMQSVQKLVLKQFCNMDCDMCRK